MLSVHDDSSTTSTSVNEHSSLEVHTDGDPSVEEECSSSQDTSNTNAENADANTCNNSSTISYSTTPTGVSTTSQSVHGDFELPHSAPCIQPVNVERVQNHQYNIKDFGNHKYHKGHNVKGLWVVGDEKLQFQESLDIN